MAGNHENTEIGEFLIKYLDVDVDSVAKELKEKGALFDAVNGEGGGGVGWGEWPRRGRGWMGRIIWIIMRVILGNIDGAIFVAYDGVVGGMVQEHWN